MRRVANRSTVSPPCSLIVATSFVLCVAALLVTPLEAQAGVEETAAAADEAQDVAPLDAWRKVQEACREAIREPDTDERIIRCEEFMKGHGDHEDKKPLLQALIDAYLETDDYKPTRVGELLVMLASLDDKSYREPVGLIDTYFLKHGLPLESAQKLLEMTATRLERERKKLEDIEDPKRRRQQSTLLDYYENRALTLEGLLRLEHGDTEGALVVLRQAEDDLADFPHGVLVFDEQGKEVRTFSTGLMDELYLGLAAANARTGHEDAGREYLAGMLGFFSDETFKELLAEVRTELDVSPPSGLEVSADPVAAPEFTLKDLDGNEFSLSDYRGKVVFLNFWATWCGPCRREMPILQRFEKAHADKGVVVLAISTDRFEDRSQIQPFMEKNNFGFKVLLEDSEELAGYDHSAIPSLYIIDREGRIAAARTGYDPDMKEKLEGQILDIINGEPNTGRTLVTVEKAPSDFGVLWMQPVEGDVGALAIAPPLGDQPGEVAAVGRPGLMRWSATGEHLGNAPLQGRSRGLYVEDLDANGRREWILTSWSDIKVLDDSGELYWSHEPGTRGIEVTAIQDLDGDDLMEIVIKGNNRVVALRHVPDSLWDNDDFKDLQAVQPDPGGALLAQTEDRLHALDAEGRLSESSVDVKTAYEHAGRIGLGENRWLDFFAGQWDRAPQLEYDVDGDGRKDVVITSWEGIEAYDVEGSPILRISGDDSSFDVAVGDLDGRPGDEVVLFVKHYGLVALGRKTAAGGEVARR